jgi:hypothetical protein
MELSSTTNMVAAAVGMNMQAVADLQIASAADYGVSLDVRTEVYVSDGSKTWPSTLATALCEKPELAKGTRQDMADLVTNDLQLSKPFNVTRLSQKLSSKAVEVVSDTLKRFGYLTFHLERGLDIRDIVKAGKVVSDHTESKIQTKFAPDGVWLGSKWYPYERISSYETGKPWYCFGIRFAGYVTPLSTVLAMRDIGISQFIGLDEAALHGATPDQAGRREVLLRV